MQLKQALASSVKGLETSDVGSLRLNAENLAHVCAGLY